MSVITVRVIDSQLTYLLRQLDHPSAPEVEDILRRRIDALLDDRLTADRK